MWKNEYYVFVVHFNLCFDYCYAILNGEVVRDVCIQRKAEYVKFCLAVYLNRSHENMDISLCLIHAYRTVGSNGNVKN